MKRLLAYLACACLLVCTVATATAQTLTSDKQDYAPGETATLTGAGFAANETVTLQVLHADGTPSSGADHDPWTVVADVNGAFVATWHVCEDDCVGALLEATAVGQSGLRASVQFTDDANINCRDACAPSLKAGNVPSSGSAVVDGVKSPGEWSAADLWTNMYIAGQSDKPLASRAYVKFVCNADKTIATVYILVEAAPGFLLDVDSPCGGNNFVKICETVTGVGSSNKVVDSCDNPAGSGPFHFPTGVQSHFQYGGVVGATAQFYEASFSLPAGTTYSVFPHTDVNGGQTSAASSGSVCMTLTCPTNCTEPPTLVGCVERTIDLGCNPANPPACDNSITASDCQGPVAVVCTPGPVTGTGCNKTQVFTYSATGTGGTSTCAVTYTWKEDTEMPVLPALTPGTDLGCNPVDLPSCATGLTATDNCDGTVPVSCEAAAIVSDGCHRSQTFTYTATDACGNTATQSETFTWTMDTTGPVLNNVPQDNFLGCNPPNPPDCDPNVTATDDCDPDVVVECTPGAPENIGGCTWRQTFTYSATDHCGNNTSHVVTYQWVEDHEAPDLTKVLPPGGFIGCNPKVLPTCIQFPRGAGAPDNCDREVPVTCLPGKPVQDGCHFTLTFTYIARDKCGNEARQDVVYTWTVDLQRPSFNNLPTGGDLGCNPTPPDCDPNVTASDDCDPSVAVICQPGDLVENGCLRSQDFTYSARDACGNLATATVSYTWKVDVTKPVLPALPSGGELGCNPANLPVCATGLVATDDCDGDLPVTCTPGEITGEDCAKSQTFTYSATDGCGNTTSQDVTYTWKIDTTPPEFVGLPSGGNLSCNPNPLPSCDDAVTAMDNCDGSVHVECVASEIHGGPPENPCLRVQTFTYTATDACNNRAEEVVTYSWIEDTTPPVIQRLPVGGYLGCNIGPKALPRCANLFAFDDCMLDKEGRPVLVKVECIPGRIVEDGCNRSQTFTYRAVDNCKNVASEDVTYTWKEDLERPILGNLPTGGDLGCNPATLPICDDNVTATDRCDGPVQVTCTDGGITDVGTCGKSQTFTYSATDGCGNTVSQDVTYTWKVDTTAPVLGNLPTSGSLGCNPETLPSCATSVTATDDCDGSLEVSCTAGEVTGPDCAKSQTFTYSATDGCGNTASETVTYTWKVDTTKPALANLPAGGDLGCNPTPPSCASDVTATDNCDGSVDVTCVPGAISDVGTCGKSQTFTYSATDGCGNTASETVTYTWKVDTTKPVLANLPAGGNLGCNPANLPSCASDVTAMDDCDGSLNVTCVAGDITGSDCAKSQTFTYSATDGCGNTASETVTYTWKIDVTPPVLANLPAGGDLGCNPTRPSCSSDATATDNCDGTVNVKCVAGDVTNVGTCGKSQTFTYSAVDACGNPVSQDVTFTWKEDTTAPVLANLPTGGDLGCNPTLPSCSNDVTATDDCDGTVHVTCRPGDVVNVGTCGRSQTFTYSATDGCGNTTSKDVTYTWTADTTPPTISCTNIVVSLKAGQACPTVVNFSNFTASDDCGTVTVSPLSGTFPVGTTSVTITATDGCGNKATCTFDVIVKSEVCVNKFNDYNANGIQDGSEPGLSGVTFTLNPGGLTATTDANGKACFSDLVAGNYTVTETLASGWLNISPKSQTVTLGCPATLQFGNVKLGGCGGLTLGFWSNKNGQALETSGDFAALTALCLRNADGSNRDFVAMLNINKSNFAAWILGANATNMAHMLSAQLAAMTLNVAHGNVSGSALVYAPGCGNAGPGNAFISVNSLLAAANAELCAHPVTLSGSPYRATQECLKIALDSANNNLNFIVTPNCPTGSAGGAPKSGGTMN